jgi:protein-disulfide isomerase
MINLTRRTVLAAALICLAVSFRPAAAADPMEPRPGDMAFGSADAPVTMIEYYSLNCSHCAAFHREVFPELKARYIDTGKVRMVFRDFPLNWPAAEAAMLTHCAGPERFLAVQHALFETYRRWSAATPSLLAVAEVGESVGVTRAEFKACLETDDLQDQVIASFNFANETLGVSGTPTFFINGEKHVGGISPERLAEIVDSHH